MNLSNKNLKLIIPFLLFIGIGVYGIFSVNFIITEKVFSFVLKWFSFPAILMSLYYAYHGTFGYPSIIPFWKNLLTLLILAAVCFIMFLASFQGFSILYNSNLGEQKNYILDGKIIKLETTENKYGNKSYSININRTFEKDTIKLEVPNNNYKVNDKFKKIMKIGSLDIIYSKN